MELFGRRKLRDMHHCAPHEYTPPSKPDGWHVMPKKEIPIEEAPQGVWSPPGSEQWPPEGKYPCVMGDGSMADLAGTKNWRVKPVHEEKDPYESDPADTPVTGLLKSLRRDRRDEKKEGRKGPLFS